MASTTKNYLQTQLFPDEDLKLPKHDEIMFWLDKNASKIVEEFVPQNLSHLIDSECKKRIQEELFEIKSYFVVNQMTKEVDKIDNLNLFDKSFDRTLPIKEIRKIWEFQVNVYNQNYYGSNKKAIGFVDMKMSFSFPTYPKLYGFQKERSDKSWSREICSYIIGENIGIGFENEVKNLYFEVKTKIDSVGSLIRQINYYRNYISDGKFIVVSEDENYKDILSEQGIGFYKYDANKFLK